MLIAFGVGLLTLIFCLCNWILAIAFAHPDNVGEKEIENIWKQSPTLIWAMIGAMQPYNLEVKSFKQMRVLRCIYHSVTSLLITGIVLWGFIGTIESSEGIPWTILVVIWILSFAISYIHVRRIFQ